MLTTYELARRIPAERLSVFGLDPGLVPATSLSRDHPPLLQLLYRIFGPVMTPR